MLKATFYTLITLLVCSISAQAQFSIGPKASMGISMFRPNEVAKEFREGRVGFSYSGGVQIDWRFGNFGIQPELMFTQRGLNSEIESIPLIDGNGNPAGAADIVSDISVNSIDVPLLLKYHFRGKEMGGYLIAGPQINFNIGGTLTQDVFVNDELEDNLSGEEDLEIGSARSDFYKSSDFGFTIGGGMFLEMTTGKLNIDLRYRIGTSDQLTDGDPLVSSRANFRTADLMVSVGYVFPLGGKW
jgi:hypothetical protein